MKIAMLSFHHNNGGAAIACGRLVKALRENGHEVHWIVQEGGISKEYDSLGNTFFQKIGNYIRFVAERLYFLPFEKNKSIRFLFNPGIFGQNLSHHPSIQSADIIHLHFTNFGFLSIQNIQQLLALGKPVFWTLHDMWAFTGGCHHSGTCENYQSQCGFCEEFIKKPAKNDLSNQLWQKKLKAFKAPNLQVITCSNWLKQRAQKSSILKNHNISAIPNTLDSHQIFVPNPKEKAKKALDLNTDLPLLLFVAVRPNAIKKGFKQFIEAIKILESQTNFQIGIVGNVIDKSVFESIKTKIHFFGHISELEKMAMIYQAADTYITTSLEENLPNTIMEAMACGTPCVGFEIGGIPEMIDHQKNGYVAKAFDTADFAHGILETIKNKESWGKLARVKVEEQYAEKIIVQKHLEVYQNALNNEV
ncbi:glycosyltransferase [Sandaracinomonas limnophila]|nr:glycosyltransferase [Sandaracinomonas limnophila]